MPLSVHIASWGWGWGGGLYTGYCPQCGNSSHDLTLMLLNLVTPGVISFLFQLLIKPSGHLKFTIQTKRSSTTGKVWLKVCTVYRLIEQIFGFNLRVHVRPFKGPFLSWALARRLSVTFDARFGRSKKSTCGYKSGLMSIAFNATASLIRSSTRPSNSRL